MTTATYQYLISISTANNKVDLDALMSEIRDDPRIVVAVSHLNLAGDVLEIIMKTALDASGQTALTQIVNAHTGEPLTAAPPTVLIKEEAENVTQGEYQTESFELYVPEDSTSGWHYKDIVWPYNTSVFSAKWVNMPNMEGDLIKVTVGQNTPIGALTEPGVSGQKIFKVQQSVIDNIKKGYKVNFIHSVSGYENDLGRCIDYDPVESTITTEFAAVNVFSASPPSFVRMTIDYIPCIRLRDRYQIKVGEDVIGGSLIPANFPVRLHYQNNEGSAKVFSVITEIKY